MSGGEIPLKVMDIAGDELLNVEAGGMEVRTKGTISRICPRRNREMAVIQEIDEMWSWTL